MASVKVTDRIEASADRVWDLVGDFGGIQRFSAGIESVSVAGEGVGAVRTITLPGGMSLHERLEARDPATRTLQYSIVGAHPMPFSDYLATIRLTEEGAATQIEWSSDFAPKPGAEGQAATIIEGIYRGGIAGLKKALRS
ncbi:MAG TPA: SRPBCC family protein [Myxococcota bacterium]|nr:SRPBCC family protein [Myxococcota bacterium]